MTGYAQGKRRNINVISRENLQQFFPEGKCSFVILRMRDHDLYVSRGRRYAAETVLHVVFDRTDHDGLSLRNGSRFRESIELFSLNL